VVVGILIGIVTGLIANELCEFSPWCARKLVRWSAFRRYTDPGRAELRAEELTRLINDRPGKLFKLITAVGFATAAVIVAGRRALTWEPDADSNPAVSDLAALRRQVTHLTFHDGLTGLPNRAYAERRAQDVLSQDRDAAAAALAVADPPVPGVIIVDIDGLTAVNDARGHTTGDLLLAQVARRLRRGVSPEDTVARWGSDEFVVIAEATVSAAELADIAERLTRGVAAKPFQIGDCYLSITASAGAALADGSPAAQVWRNAELALARAKASGGGRAEV
jgi:diguanylate cyclase (GGDEF)-like protein